MGGFWNSLNDFKMFYVERGFLLFDKVNMIIEECLKFDESEVLGIFDGD